MKTSGVINLRIQLRCQVRKDNLFKKTFNQVAQQTSITQQKYNANHKYKANT